VHGVRVVGNGHQHTAFVADAVHIAGQGSDIAEASSVLQIQKSVAFGDAGYQGVEKHPGATKDLSWHVAMRPSIRKALKTAEVTIRFHGFYCEIP
jgi:hypothetical protein